MKLLAHSIFAVRARIEREMRAAYLDPSLKWNSFFPQQFIDAGVGDEGQVMAALMELVRTGHLCVQATLRCHKRHAIWTGSLHDVEKHRRLMCRECEDAESSSGEVVTLRFDISDEWHAELDADAREPQGAVLQFTNRLPR
jgi:hypothetical protein